MKSTPVTILLLLALLVSCRKEEIFVEPEVVEYLTEEEAKDLPRTGLPVVIINTRDEEEIGTDKVWRDSATIVIANPDMSVNLRSATSIKTRGNLSLLFPKLSYNIKLDRKAKVLGMHKHKRWCLLANWSDRTLMRNAVTFELARRSPGLDWTPAGEYVELVLNGKHVGNYYLCEQIRVDNHRVNVTETDLSVTSGDALTGGYLMELDEYFDEEYKFKSKRKGMPWMFRDPDVVNSAQAGYMENYVNDMEKALYTTTLFKARKFTEYMDLGSFADLWIVNELATNIELEHPKSCFVHKDVNGPIEAGPVWDFDWNTYNPKGISRWYVRDTFYFRRLFEDDQFRSLVKQKWQAQKHDYEDVAYYYIDGLKEQLSASDSINSVMWPVWYEANSDCNLSFDKAVNRMKAVLRQRIEWMDNQISQW